MNDPADTIADAVQTCVDYAINSDRPFHQIADFMLMLKGCGRSDDDLRRIHAEVIAEMARRRGTT